MPLKKEVLAKYLNPVFVETGTAYGNGVQTALECGFKSIYSTEPNELLYKLCLNRFEGVENIHLYNLNSEDFLQEFLTMNNDGDYVTYYLDSHRNGRKDPTFQKPCPILEELNIIFNMNADDYFTILIDDVRLFKNKKWGISLEQILEYAKDMNITYEDGYKEKDILVIS